MIAIRLPIGRCNDHLVVRAMSISQSTGCHVSTALVRAVAGQSTRIPSTPPWSRDSLHHALQGQSWLRGRQAIDNNTWGEVVSQKPFIGEQRARQREIFYLGVRSGFF